MDFEAILEKAYEAAKKASTEKRSEIGERDMCGFAWVHIPEGRGGLPAYCRKKIKEAKDRAKLYFPNREDSEYRDNLTRGVESYYGDKHWQRGWEFWSPGKSNSQSITVHEAGATAFAKVLCEHGIKAYMGSRLD